MVMLLVCDEVKLGDEFFREKIKFIDRLDGGEHGIWPLPVVVK